ncbi:hypothetical protein THF5H11_250003 [Vibrio jasicida]|nr:hypothetical protein THF5H11_250003 [Vibrio jasicida]
MKDESWIEEKRTELPYFANFKLEKDSFLVLQQQHQRKTMLT